MEFTDSERGLIGTLDPNGVIKNLQMRNCSMKMSGGSIYGYGFFFGVSNGIENSTDRSSISNCSSVDNLLIIDCTTHKHTGGIGGLIFATNAVNCVTTNLKVLHINTNFNEYSGVSFLGGVFGTICTLSFFFLFFFFSFFFLF